MGDDQGGTAGQHPVQGRVHGPLGGGVHAGGGLVEDQDAGCAQHHPGQRDELALAGRQTGAALVDVAVVPLGQRADETVRADGLGRRDDVRAGGVRPAQGDVVRHGAGEEERFLGDHADAGAQFGVGHLAQVGPVQGDPPARRVVQPRQQLGQRRLARPGRTDQRHGLRGRQLQVQPGQYVR